MIFRSETVDAQWDTWCYYHDGQYYLYYLITENSPGEGFGVASSSDGVHWEDHGWAIHRSDEAWDHEGTGAVWISPDYETTGRFLCNYQENRKEADGRVTQNIFFGWSTDLIHWTKFGHDLVFKADGRFYRPTGRWDCIFAMERPEGGYYGTWTASALPDSANQGTVGIGYSDDGLHWNALPAPEVNPGVSESGAFHRFGGRIHAMFGKEMRMWAYTADDVSGPYLRAEKNALLLDRGHTYFTRFLLTPDGVLVNHHAMSGSYIGERWITYASPLKLAEVDHEGVLRFKYWSGNDALKGEAVAPCEPEVQPGAYVITGDLDFRQGVVVEGTLSLPDTLRPAPVGLCLLIDDERYGIRVLDDGRVEMGLLNPPGHAWAVRHRADREWDFGDSATFRLLARRGMLEFYLDDHFMEAWTMECPDATDVRVGMLGRAEDRRARDVEVWQMNLS